MNLYIVRHGESTWNNESRIQGHSNPALSALGRAQARLAGKRLKKESIDKIYSSPLKRSFQTAQIISKTLKLKISKEPQLKEIMLGDWEGMMPEEIDRMYNKGYQKWLEKGPTKVSVPKAERITSFRKRIEKTFHEIVNENRGKNVVVITHGGVISAFLAHLLNADFDKVVLELYIANACMSVVSFHGSHRPYILKIADASHLSSIQARGLWPVKRKK